MKDGRLLAAEEMEYARSILTVVKIMKAFNTSIGLAEKKANYLFRNVSNTNWRLPLGSFNSENFVYKNGKNVTSQ